MPPNITTSCFFINKFNEHLVKSNQSYRIAIWQQSEFYANPVFLHFFQIFLECIFFGSPTRNLLYTVNEIAQIVLEHLYQVRLIVRSYVRSNYTLNLIPVPSSVSTVYTTAEYKQKNKPHPFAAQCGNNGHVFIEFVDTRFDHFCQAAWWPSIVKSRHKS